MEALRCFMEQNYGKVDRCVKDKFNNRNPNGRGSRFPPGRVTFVTRQAAEKIFNGKALRDARPINLSCPSVGHREIIGVRPSHRYNGMLEHALTGNCLSFQSDFLSIGHWLPSFDDIYLTWSSTTKDEEVFNTSNQENESFHREAVHQGSLSVSIDLSARKIEISATNVVATAPLLQIITALTSSVSVMTVRFKDLRNQFSLCKDTSSGKVLSCLCNQMASKAREDVYGYEAKGHYV